MSELSCLSATVIDINDSGLISNPVASELYYPQSGHGSAVSLELIGVGKRHCRVLRLYHSGVTGIDITQDYEGETQFPSYFSEDD